MIISRAILATTATIVLSILSPSIISLVLVLLVVHHYPLSNHKHTGDILLVAPQPAPQCTSTITSTSIAVIVVMIAFACYC